jgi:hypothetical protein
VQERWSPQSGHRLEGIICYCFVQLQKRAPLAAPPRMRFYTASADSGLRADASESDCSNYGAHIGELH